MRFNKDIVWKEKERIFNLILWNAFSRVVFLILRLPPPLETTITNIALQVIGLVNEAQSHLRSCPVITSLHKEPPASMS